MRLAELELMRLRGLMVTGGRPGKTQSHHFRLGSNATALNSQWFPRWRGLRRRTRRPPRSLTKSESGDGKISADPTRFHGSKTAQALKQSDRQPHENRSAGAVVDRRRSPILHNGPALRGTIGAATASVASSKSVRSPPSAGSPGAGTRCQVRLELLFCRNDQVARSCC